MLATKLELLKNHIKTMESVLVSYSGGMDSTLLLHIARQILGEKAQGVLFNTVFIPDWDIEDALKTATHMGVQPHVRDIDVLSDKTLVCNPEDRCYICKGGVLSRALALALELGLKHVVEGSHADDLLRHRPGHRAIQELGVISPFQACGIGKADIQELSRKYGLPTWNKPSFSCLATRLPHGERIEEEVLRRVGQTEKYMRDLGFKIFRVRHRGSVARVEYGVSEDERLMAHHNGSVEAYLRGLGYSQVEFGVYMPS